MRQAAVPAELPTPASGRTIGEILLSRSLVTDEELDEAIAIQRETGKPLGQILVEAGTITRLELASALAEQWGDAGTISPTFPGGSAYVDPAVSDGSPTAQLEELRHTRRALEERMLAFERTAEDAQWQQEMAAGVRALFGRVDVLEASIGEVTESGLLSELRQLVVDLAQRVEAMTPELESVRERVDGTASVAAVQYGLSEIAERIDDVAPQAARAEAQADALADRVEEIGAGLAAAIDEVRRTVHVSAAAQDQLADRLDAAAPLETIESLRIAMDEVRGAIAELHDRPAADPYLAARVDELAARLEAAAVEDLTQAVIELGRRPSGDAELTRRVEQLVTQVDELGERIELGAGTVSGDGEPDPRVDALIARVAELASRPVADPELEARLAETVGRIDAVAAELASRPVGDPELETRLAETASRIDAVAAELAARPAGDPTLEARLAETAHRVDAVAAELAGRADAAGQAELSRLVAELAARHEGDPSVAVHLREVEARLDEVASRPLADPALTARLDELAARLDEVPQAADASVEDGRVDELVSAVADLAARVDALGEGPAGGMLPSDLDERLAEAVTASASLSDQLSQTITAWRDGHRTLEARIEWLAARMEADAATPTEPVAGETRSSKRRDPAAEGGAADVERLRMAVERLMLDFADHRRAISATVPSRDLDARLRKLSDQVDELSGAVNAGGNGGVQTSRAGDGGGGGSIDRELAGQVKAVLGRLEEVEASATAGRETMLARLERMMGTIDWRLQRLESPDAK